MLMLSILFLRCMPTTNLRILELGGVRGQSVPRLPFKGKKERGGSRYKEKEGVPVSAPLPKSATCQMLERSQNER
jgi:hypothetical protein